MRRIELIDKHTYLRVSVVFGLILHRRLGFFRVSRRKRFFRIARLSLDLLFETLVDDVIESLVLSLALLLFFDRFLPSC